MGSTSNRYTPEFKQRAVQLYESRKPVTFAEVARELGVDPGSLSKWVKESGASQGSPESDNPFQTAEDLRKLRRENERLRRENETLLKAGTFFASRQL